jgi:hypothetical protein
MKVLVIPEDQELDRYIVRPVIEALFAELEIRARVDVLPEPRLRGASQALDPAIIGKIIDENPMIDLFRLVVDRDCDRDGNEMKATARVRENPGKLIACVALQELEVWLLALYKDELGVLFSKVRADCDPKEQWAEPLLANLGTDSPGKGRKSAMKKLAGNYRSLRDTCTEIRDLENAVRAWRAGC